MWSLSTSFFTCFPLFIQLLSAKQEEKKSEEIKTNETVKVQDKAFDGNKSETFWKKKYTGK